MCTYVYIHVRVSSKGREGLQNVADVYFQVEITKNTKVFYVNVVMKRNNTKTNE